LLLGSSEAELPRLYDRYSIPAELARFPRFWHVSSVTGDLQCTETLGFCQEDLDNAHMAMLDTGATIFVWEGTASSADERKRTYEMAVEYAAERKVDAVRVLAGYECVQFCSHFVGWKANDLLPLHQAPRPLPVADFLREYTRIYSFDQLVNSRPTFLDATALEKYLSDAEFVQLFGCSREKFYWLYPPWRQLELKKKLGLY